MVEKKNQGNVLGTQALYLLGMTSVLLSSKYEDVIPIPADSLIKKAGHNKFALKELVELERDVLMALRFKIHPSADLYNEAALLY